MAEENEPNDQNANSIQLGEKITGASFFEFKIGGNSTIGDNGYNANFPELAEIFGIDVLPSSGAVSTIVDQYII